MTSIKNALLSLFFLVVSHFGFGQFVEEHIISMNSIQHRSFDVADFNLDGKLDYIVSGYGYLWWIQNEGFEYGEFHIVNSTIYDAITKVEAYDIDFDGDPDIVGCHDDGIFWNENQGDGTFSETQIIYQEEYNQCLDFVLHDIDNDLDIDLVATLNHPEYTRLSYFENLGDEEFSSENVVHDEFGSYYLIELGNFNEDSIVDLAITSSYYDLVAWCSISDDGTFTTPEVLVPFDVDPTDEIEGLVDQPNSLLCFDSDSDGDDDIIVSSSQNGTCILFENLGDDSFEEPVFLFDSIFCFRSLNVFDMDDDNDLDLVVGDYECGLQWIENTGGDFENFHEISLESDFPVQTIFRDYNEDNQEDLFLLNPYQHNVSLFERSEDDEFLPPRNISRALSDADDVYSADLDEDGDNDILVIDDTGSLIQYINDGNGNFGESVIISDQIHSSRQIEVFDMNEDGHLDILVASTEYNRIYSLMGNGDGTFLTPETMIDNVYGIKCMALGDMNGDGQVDLVTGTSQDDKIKVHHNLGLGVFDGHITVYNDADFVQDIALADLDQDGNLDIVCVNSWDNEVVLIENGYLDNYEVHYIATDYLEPSDIEIADMDLDGLLDLIVTSRTGGTIELFKNEGELNFADPELIIDAYGYPRSTLVEDVDNDGDSDILFISGDPDASVLILNDGMGGLNIGYEISNYGFESQLITGDFNSDGTRDLLVYCLTDDKLSWFESHFDPVFLEEVPLKKDQLLFPNPVDSEAILELKNMPSYVSIFDNSGRLVRDYGWVNSKNLIIKKEFLSPGFYIIHIQDQDSQNIHSTKMIVE